MRNRPGVTKRGVMQAARSILGPAIMREIEASLDPCNDILRLHTQMARAGREAEMSALGSLLRAKSCGSGDDPFEHHRRRIAEADVRMPAAIRNVLYLKGAR